MAIGTGDCQIKCRLLHPNRSTIALTAAVGMWILLLMLQWSVGPRDGVVPEILRHPEWVSGVGPLLGTAWIGPGQSGTALALLLFLAPSALLLAAHIARRARLRPLLALPPVIALGLLSLLDLPQLSNDLFLYRAAGEMINDGVNPYIESPADHFHSTRLRGIPWTTQKSPYGPLALQAFGAAATWAPSWIANYWSLRVLMALPWAFALLLVWRRARTDSAVLLFVGASPLLLIEVVQSGHVDGWVGLLLMSVCATLSRDSTGSVRRAWFVIALAAAIAIKLSALVVTGAVFVHLLRRPDWGLRRALVAASSVVVLIALIWIPLWAGPSTFDGLRTESTKVLQSIFQVLHVPTSAAGAVTTGGSIVALLVGAILSLRGWSVVASCIVALTIQAILGRTFLQPWCFVAPVMLCGWAMAEGTSSTGRERAVIDPWVWGVASVGLVFGGYALVFATRSISPSIQSSNVALMLVPGLVAWFIRARQRV